MSVKVGFLYMDVFQQVGGSFDGDVKVVHLVAGLGFNCEFWLGYIVLMSSNMFWMSVWLESLISRTSST